MLELKELEGFTDKASKNPEELVLYQNHDYITAYGRHTDLRIARDGYQGAIGSNDKAGQGWDEHGSLQLNFLKSRGLEPEHTLLDLGCGTGRLARQVVPYLNAGNYTGMDISSDAIATAIKLSQNEGWDAQEPELIHGDGTLSKVKGRSFNLIWAHSVFTHLPPEIIEQIFDDLREIAFGEFCFTYKRADKERRSGLKQFQYRPQYFIDLGQFHNLQVTDLGIDWPAGQKTMVVRR